MVELLGHSLQHLHKDSMDTSLRVEMKIVKNEKIYIFSMPMGAPHGEAYDACFEALLAIHDLSKVAAEQAKRPDSEA